LNDLTRKRRGGDIITNETEHFRLLGAHVPGVMVGAVFQRLGRPQDTLPDLIFDMRTSVNDPRDRLETDASKMGDILDRGHHSRFKDLRRRKGIFNHRFHRLRKWGFWHSGRVTVWAKGGLVLSHFPGEGVQP
jgi:hypothetical protein